MLCRQLVQLAMLDDENNDLPPPSHCRHTKTSFYPMGISQFRHSIEVQVSPMFYDICGLKKYMPFT